MSERARAGTDRNRYRLLVGQLRTLSRRIESLERRNRQLENALKGLSRSLDGCRIGPPCSECERSLLLVSDGFLYCPRCSYRRSL